MAVLDHTPLLYVTIDDARAPVDLTRAVLSLEVDEHDKKATKITLELDDPEQRFRAMLPEGAQIAVRWGWVGAISAPRGGIIHRVKASYDDLRITVEAYGKELALSRGAVKRTFRGATFREALTTLTRDAGLTLRFEAADTIRFDGQVVDDETAWGWVQRKSAELGLVVVAENGEVVVREPPLGQPAAHVLLWGWKGSTLNSFEVEENTKKGESENEGVVAVFSDPATGAMLQHAAGAPNTTRRTLARRALDAARRRTQQAERAACQAYVAEHPELEGQTTAQQEAAWQASRTQRAAQNRPPTEDEPSMLTVLMDSGEVRPDTAARSASTSPTSGASQTAADGRQTATTVPAGASAAREHARRAAEGQFKAHERGKVKAKAECEGIPSARRGNLVRVLGVEERDGGLWYAEGCKQKIDDGGYVTSFELKRDGVNSGKGARRRGATATPSGAATPPAGAAAAAGATNDNVAVNLDAESA